jgi:hypothetical protein
MDLVSPKGVRLARAGVGSVVGSFNETENLLAGFVKSVVDQLV